MRRKSTAANSSNANDAAAEIAQAQKDRKNGNRKTKPLVVRIPNAAMAEIEAMARADNRSLSYTVARLVEAGLRGRAA